MVISDPPHSMAWDGYCIIGHTPLCKKICLRLYFQTIVYLSLSHKVDQNAWSHSVVSSINVHISSDVSLVMRTKFQFLDLDEIQDHNLNFDKQTQNGHCTK